jgi:hypothetical protein
MSMWYDSGMIARWELEKNYGSSGWIEMENIEEMDLPHLKIPALQNPNPN